MNLKKFKKNRCPRASLGSLSEASTVFDSELPKNIIQQLSLKMPNVSTISGFDNSKRILAAVDGSVIEAVGKMAWALWRGDRNGIKIHCQYEILKGAPVSMELTDVNTNEKAVFAAILQPNRIYVLDLISHNKNGIEIQVYVAIIACMLISLWTRRKPAKRTYEMICWNFMGLADDEELDAHIASLKPHH